MTNDFPGKIQNGKIIVIMYADEAIILIKRTMAQDLAYNVKTSLKKS